MTVSALPVLSRLQFNVTLPVLMKEMRVRMRGMRAPILLFVATALTIIIGLIIIMPQWDNFSYSGNDARWSMVQIGKSLFSGLTVLECILCGLIAPALTAGAVSIEREQQTLDLLLLTRLSNMNILLGKLLSALSFVGMILLCALPVASISFLLGGVDPGQLVWSAALIFTTACFFSTIALHCSVRYPRTSTAVAVAYCLCLGWLAVIPILTGLAGEFLGNEPTQAFYTFIAGASVIVAVLPMLVLSALFILIFRQPVPRWFSISSWFVSAIVCFGLLRIYAQPICQAAKNNPEYFFLGNPFIGVGEVLGATFNSSASWIYAHFVPLSVLCLVVGTLMVLVLTNGEFKRLRK